MEVSIRPVGRGGGFKILLGVIQTKNALTLDGVECGVENALQLNFEHVYFQKFSGGYITRPQDNRK